MSDYIYLDYNATAPIRPEALEAVQEALSMPRNASSVHRYGRGAKALIEKHRKALADMLSCWPTELVFTASGTEASNQIYRTFAHMPHCVSAVEHDAVLQCVTNPSVINVDCNGIVNLTTLEQQLIDLDKPALVAVMAANNETGVVQPVSQVADIVHRYDGLLYVDCAQALGKMPVDLTLMQADIASFSAHKIGAGCGAGLLYIRQGLEISPLLRGGGQEFGRRGGTENVAAIAAFGSAVKAACQQTQWQPQLRGWLNAMEQSCMAVAQTQEIILSRAAPRLCNTSMIIMPDVPSQTQLMQFDLAGFALSAGSACSSGKVNSSHVVRAMRTGDAADNSIRISAGWDTTQRDVQLFGEAWAKLYIKKTSQTA